MKHHGLYFYLHSWTLCCLVKTMFISMLSIWWYKYRFKTFSLGLGRSPEPVLMSKQKLHTITTQIQSNCDLNQVCKVKAGVFNLCCGAGWVCWGAWSHDKQEAALPLVVGLHRCGQRTGWWTSRGLRSGWVPRTNCSTPLVSYCLLILRNIQHKFIDTTTRVTITVGDSICLH